MSAVTQSAGRTRIPRAIPVLVRYLGLVAATVVFAFPLYWMVATAVLPPDQVFAYPPRLLPLDGSLDPFVSVVQRHPLLRWLVNSAVVAGASSAACVLLGVLGGYALSRFRFRGAGVTVVLILLTQMLPTSLLIIPIFIIYRDFGMLDTLWGLGLGYMTFNLPFCLWILKGFVDAIPIDLEEASLADGSTRVGALFRITLPLIVPGVVATFLFAFIGAWSDYVFALTILSSPDKFTYAVGIGGFKGEYQTPWNEIMAASALSTLPILILFVFMQRYLLAGLTAGGVKG